MSNRVPRINCVKCGGKGVTPLPEKLLKVLNLFGRNTELTAQEVQSKLGGIGITGFNNRLETLRALGFIIRTQSGKSWIYRRASAIS